MAFNIFGQFTINGKPAIESMAQVGKVGKGLTQTFARMANVFDMPGLRKLSGVFAGFSSAKGIIVAAATALATMGVMAYKAAREWVKLNNIMANFAIKSGQSKTEMKGLGKELNAGIGMLSGLELTGDATLAVGELEVAYRRLKDEAARSGIPLQLPDVKNVRELIDALDQLPAGQRLSLIEQYFGTNTIDAQNILQYGKAASAIGKVMKDAKWAAAGSVVGNALGGGTMGALLGQLAPGLANKYFKGREEKDAIKARIDYSVNYQTQANKQIADMRKAAEESEMSNAEKIAHKRERMFSNPAVKAEIKTLQEGMILDQKRLDAATDFNEKSKIAADIADKEQRYAQLRRIATQSELDVAELIKKEKKEALDIAEDHRQAQQAITDQLMKERSYKDQLANIQQKINRVQAEENATNDPLRKNKLYMERMGYMRDMISLQQEFNNKIQEERQTGAESLFAKNKELSLQGLSAVAAGTNLQQLSSGRRVAEIMAAVERNTRMANE